MHAVSADTLPELPSPRGYVPACEPLPPRTEPIETPTSVDGIAGFGAGSVPAAGPGREEFFERLLATASAARARMDYPAAAAACALGAQARRDDDDPRWAERFADEAAALALLSPPREDGDTELAWVEGLAASDPGAAQKGPDPLRPRQRLNGAIGLALQGLHAEALREIDTAQSGLAADDAYGRLLATLNRAQALLESGDVDAAAHEAAAALRLARREKRDHWVALAGLGAALVHLARGRRNEARTRLGDAVRLFARFGDALGQVQSHYLLGELAWLGEDPIRAGAHYRDALGVARAAAAQEWIELLTLRFEHR